MPFLTKPIFKILFVLSTFILLVLVMELIVTPDLVIDDQQGDTQIHIQAVSQFVFLPHHHTTIYWETENATSVKLRGLDADLRGRIAIADMGDYDFNIIASDGNEYHYRVHIIAWVLNPLRVTLAIVGSLLFCLSGYTLGYLQKFWCFYASIVEPQDYLAIPSNIWSDIKDNRYSLFILSILGISVHATLWLGWPLHSGADSRSYVTTYLTAFQGYEDGYYSMIFIRGPLPSILHGMTLSVGVWLNMFIQTLMALSTVVMVYLILLPWKKVTAWFGAITFLLYIPIQLFFHQVSSEGSFVWATILVLFVFRYALTQKNTAWWVILGVTVGIAYLARVSALAFIILLSARLLQSDKLKNRLQDISFAGLAIALVILPWVIYRGVKFDYFALGRNSGTLLFTSAYNFNLIQPGNGPYTERFINLIEQHLLIHQNYQNEQITLDHILSPDSYHRYDKWVYYNDLVYILDILVGWDESHPMMSKIGMEAVMAQPEVFMERAIRNVDVITHTKAPLWLAEPINMNTHRLLPLYSHYLTYPAYIPPPNPEVLIRVEQKTSELLVLVSNVTPDLGIANQVQMYWIQYFPPPIILYLFGIVALLRSRNSTFFYLLYINIVASAVIVPSVMLSDTVRYRLVVDNVFIIGFAIGFSEVCTFLTRRIRQVRKG